MTATAKMIWRFWSKITSFSVFTTSVGCSSSFSEYRDWPSPLGTMMSRVVIITSSELLRALLELITNLNVTDSFPGGTYISSKNWTQPLFNGITRCNLGPLTPSSKYRLRFNNSEVMLVILIYEFYPLISPFFALTINCNCKHGGEKGLKNGMEKMAVVA